MKILKAYLKKGIDAVLAKSIELAIAEQGLGKLARRLEEIVPDIADQYSRFKVEGRYLSMNVRGLHAFQMSLVDKVISKFRDSVVVIDIGDSAGTHIQYISGLYNRSINVKSLSVNLDEKAVEKIRKKGFEAICAKAEELSNFNVNPDIFLCFEMLEHLMDPCRFLRSLSSNTKAQYLVVTVPYLKTSRIGLHHIRHGREGNVYAENTHIFELNPTDWKLLIRHSGWNIQEERIYLQYPKYSLLSITRPWWKMKDFEGFYGLILTRDNNWSSKYQDW